MVTVGLVKELYFLSVVLRTPLDFFIGHPDKGDSVFLRIENGRLDVSYHGKHIWSEDIEGDTSFFGVESCDTISRIITCINTGDVSGADKLIYKDNLLDLKPSPA